MSNKLSVIEAKHELWRRGNLSFKCHKVQKEMYDIFYNSPKNSTLVWLLARQSGKSWLLAILALEHAIRTPNSIIKLLTDTKLHIKSIFDKIFEELTEDCPEDMKPTYMKATSLYNFANGSQIQLAGSDSGHYEKLRGQKSILVLVDEAGFCNQLDKVVKSVLLPTTTHTGGKIVLASTPPEESEHEFLPFIEEAEKDGRLTKKTILENPLLTKEQIDNMIEKMGGLHSDRVQRECFCEIIKDASTSVIPEFTPDLEKEIIKEWPLPPFYDTYVSMDLGGKDLTVVLFGYFDFRADKVIIQDELVMDFKLPQNNIATLSKSIQDKETALWTNVLTNEKKKPYLRISDINYIVTQEISKYSNKEISFITARKDDKDSAINNVRVLLGTQKVIISPRCETLIRHLRNVKWHSQNNKNTFARSPDNGHYDAVDALKYLLRHIVYSKNPYPAHYGMNTKDLYVTNPDKVASRNSGYQIETFKKLFNVQTKR